jgi:hypothetical protein
MKHSPTLEVTIQGTRAAGRRVQAIWAVALLLTPGIAAAQQAIGQSLVLWVRNNIVGPLAILLIIVTLVAAFVKPDIAKTTGYIAIMAVVVIFLMSMYPSLVTLFQ